MSFGGLQTKKMENFCQSYSLDLNIFSHGNALNLFVIYLLPLSARAKRRFFQSADRPEADPKTAIVLIAHS